MAIRPLSVSDIDAARWPDHVRLSDLEPKFMCQACGQILLADRKEVGDGELFRALRELQHKYYRPPPVGTWTCRFWIWPQSLNSPAADMASGCGAGHRAHGTSGLLATGPKQQSAAPGSRMRLRGSDPQDATYRQSTRIHGGAIVVAMKKARPGSDFRKSFAANLRRERRALGLTQKALAHMAGLDRTYVGSVERAESNISIDNIERLARALGLEPADLFKQNRS